MKFVFFDCFSGAAGDMIVGALLDAGLSLDYLRSELEKLGLSGYSLSREKVVKNKISATKFNVELLEKQPHRKPQDIIDIIAGSGLDDEAKKQSIAVFNRLAVAEGKVHGEPVEDIHFHEVGAVDAIIDICGAVIGLKHLGVEKIFSSPLSLGTGRIGTAHGVMPVPAPATAELVKNSPVRMTGIEAELTTPTGAAILTTLADFNVPETMEPKVIGYGAGSRDLRELPNLLRVMICETASVFDQDMVKVLETNLDRTSPEILGGIFEELISAGALDVYITSTLMKKNRPGQLLTVLCKQENLDRLAKIMFRRGLTLGIRVKTVPRIKLHREETVVSTSGGDVSVKIARLDDKEILFPEYDDMVKAMRKTDRSYDDIYFEIQSNLRKET
jgi:uncharacterized protein (TIGR00299 family) protein